MKPLRSASQLEDGNRCGRVDAHIDEVAARPRVKGQRSTRQKIRIFHGFVGLNEITDEKTVIMPKPKGFRSKGVRDLVLAVVWSWKGG